MKKDRSKLNQIFNQVASLRAEILNLQNELKGSKNQIQQLKIESQKLKQAVNLNTFELDDLQQHTRRENVRVHGIPESTDKKDDDETHIKKLAEELNIKLESWNIQRAHSHGKTDHICANRDPL